MKIRSLLLGSIAAAGLSTGAFAADLGVLTSLDVCDSLGLSGLTISSDTNCLQITGEVSYEFNWGDYERVDEDGSYDAVYGRTPLGTVGVMIPSEDSDGLHNDYSSEVDAWVKFVGTADSDFGPASATIKLLSEDAFSVTDGVTGDSGDTSVKIDEAYVSIGDSTVIMAGKKGSIANSDDDEPFNYVGLYNSEVVDSGVYWISDDVTGGHVIQVVSDLGNGVSVAGGLENLQGGTDDVNQDGTAVGVISYAGEGITAHVTGAAVGILNGDVNEWGVHAGVTGTFDNFKARVAVGYNDIVDDRSTLNALGSVEGTFDLFKLALSAEYVSVDVDGDLVGADRTGYGVGGSAGVTVSEGIDINLGARWFHDEIDGTEGTDDWQVEAQVVAALTETITATAAAGILGGDNVEANSLIDADTVIYGSLELAWAPGGGFESAVKGQVNSEGAYKATFTASKSFE